jgi:hypothetical protein
VLNGAGFSVLTRSRTARCRAHVIGYEPTPEVCCTGRSERCSTRHGSGRFGIRCDGGTGSCPPTSSVILAEHGTIGCSASATTARHCLACHGPDTDDNDFVIGLIGKDLYPLSRSCRR